MEQMTSEGAEDLEENEQEVEEEEEEEETVLTFSALEACIGAAEKINVNLEELQVLTSTLKRGKAWMDKTEKLCPKVSSHRHASISSATLHLFFFKLK